MEALGTFASYGADRRQVRLLDEQSLIPEQPLSSVVEGRVLSNRDGSWHNALAVLVLLAAPVRAERQKVAVLEFEIAKGLEIDRTYFSDKVRGSIQDRVPQLFVMTRESTEVLLKQYGKTLADCTGECEVETGRKLGADFVVSGRITKVGSRLALTMRLHATASGELLKTAEALAKDTDALVDATGGAVATLLGPLVGEARPAPPTRPSPASVPHRARPDASENSSVSIEPKSRLRFVSIPAGTFQYQGERQISVSAFQMGETDVTVAAYAKCVAAGACTDPKTGVACNWKTGRDDHPINCVDWNQATVFCKWIGARLPTEEEWEYVASGGSEARTYPWGNEEPGARACWDGEGNDLGKDNRKTTCPVGSHKAGDSRWGLHDLAGDVSEWTSSDYDSSSKVFRGGSWGVDGPGGLRARLRLGYRPSLTLVDVGFRCEL